jgi:hypothetical protein
MVCKYCTDKKLQDIVNAYLDPDERAQYCPVCGRSIVIVELVGPLLDDSSQVDFEKTIEKFKEDLYGKAGCRGLC